MKELIWLRNDGIPPRNEKIWKLVFYLFFLDAFSSTYWRPSQWSPDSTEHTHVSWVWTSAINQIVTLNQILQKIVLDAPLTRDILLPVFWYHLSRMQFWYFHYQLELQDQMSMTYQPILLWPDLSLKCSIAYGAKGQWGGWECTCLPIMGLFLHTH